MALQRFDPFQELRRHLLDAFGEKGDGAPNLSSFSPAVNTRETDSAYLIALDLPGVEKDGITVDLKDNALSISGERKFENEVKEDDYYRLESRYGRFERRFSLPDNADPDAIEAVFKNGVLTLTLPKAQSKNAKQIDVK
ncbi:MAG: Hsp20/alpha crystallin family protein [Helicobacteraceae bacterium]|jgi:HSP20 family protein|nr:Hsp20/alpha crystallin family protein [Helicobacteraceae bacterium]